MYDALGEQNLGLILKVNEIPDNSCFHYTFKSIIKDSWS